MFQFHCSSNAIVAVHRPVSRARSLLCGVCHKDMVIPNICPTVALPVPRISVVPDGPLPHIETQSLRGKRPQHGIPLPLDLLTIAVVGLFLVVGRLIYFNLPSNDGHQGNGEAAVKQKAKVQVGNRPTVRPKAKLRAEPGDSGQGPFDLDGEAVRGFLEEYHIKTADIVMVGLGLLLYFMPTFIAGMRGH